MKQNLLHKYFNNETSIEEEMRILDWIDESDENKNSFRKERMLFDIALFSNKTNSQKNHHKSQLYHIFKWGMRIAGSIIIIVCLNILYNDYLYNQSAVTQTITVPLGQHVQLTLADGTKVWLNSKSTLKYAANFGRKNREVTLDGEAYFEVTKNKKIPFNVNTEMNRVNVVGTHFNVCAYNRTREFETTLIEGTVDIYENGKEKPISRLTKNDFFANYNGKTTKTKLQSYAYLNWKEGLYCFDDTPLISMLNKLEKYYDTDIVIRNPQVLNYRCTGKFKEQDGIEHILKVLQKDHPFKYTINKEHNKIIIE